LEQAEQVPNAEAVADAERLAATYPYRERPRAQLMTALYRAGRQADALRAFQEARRVFVEELGIEPGRSLRELERAVLSQDPDLDAPAHTPLLERPHHNLPSPLTALLGRFDDVQAVQKLLATSRLVTIAGTGGCGKTRLALQVAADLVDASPDGVWFVDLAPLADPALVAQTVAAVLGVREQPGQPLLATLLAWLTASGCCWCWTTASTCSMPVRRWPRSSSSC
jgi:hypothetical protein